LSGQPGPGPGVLILACGNPSRGDDALGPTLIERLSAIAEVIPGTDRMLDLMTDYQLQIEHALDLQGRDLVIFVDAALSGPEPFSFAPVTPEPALSITTHALSPGGLLRVFMEAVGGRVPDCRLLAIRGYGFELGASLSPGAERNLLDANRFLLGWLASQRQSKG
jgi:hydrogenase maturation protease